MTIRAPRLSGRVLRSVVAGTGFKPFCQAIASQVRRDLGITQAIGLPESVRSPMPLDYMPLQARASRRLQGNLPLPSTNSIIPGARNWTDLYATGESTPSQLIEKALANARRMARAQPSMSCFTWLDDEGAMRDAQASTERWAKGAPLGPLDGVAVPIKEMADINGAGFRLGTAYLPERRDAVDCTSVARLRAAGAIIIGHTVMVEMGMSPLGTNIHRDMPRNAQAVDRLAGGSSTGSAVAVASGLAPVTLGCDGGGSLRIPASYNGIFSIKPTAGRVSRHGDGFGGSMDHFGPMGASAHDLAIFLDACAGPDPADPITRCSPAREENEFTDALGRGVQGLKIGVLEEEIDDAAPGVARACRAALQALQSEGAELVSVSIELSRHAPAIGFTTIGIETYAELLQQRREQWDLLGPETQLMLRMFSVFDADEYIDAQCLRSTLRAQCAEQLRKVDVLALPTTASVAPAATEQDIAQGFADIHATRAACRFTFMGNLTGLPCGHAPVGSGEAGLPVGLQIVGDAYDEASVLAVLAHLERTGAAAVRAPRLDASVITDSQQVSS